MKNMAKLDEQVVDVLDFTLPEEGMNLLADMRRNSFGSPSRFVLPKVRFTLDCACILMRHCENTGLLHKQLFFDASPQHGVELFCVREFTYPVGCPEEGKNPIMPVTTLGQGKFKAIDKAMSLLHSITLEVGCCKKAHPPWYQQWTLSPKPHAPAHTAVLMLLVPGLQAAALTPFLKVWRRVQGVCVFGVGGDLPATRGFQGGASRPPPQHPGSDPNQNRGGVRHYTTILIAAALVLPIPEQSTLYAMLLIL